MSKAVYIEGTLIIDGKELKFCCNSGDSWSQWGAQTERLGESVELMEAVQLAIEELATG